MFLVLCWSCCRNRLHSSIQDYNLYHDNAMYHLKQDELNGEPVFEGILKIFWGMKKAITLLPKPVLPKRQSVLRDPMYSSCMQLSEDPGKQVWQAPPLKTFLYFLLVYWLFYNPFPQNIITLFFLVILYPCLGLPSLSFSLLSPMPVTYCIYSIERHP